MSEFVRRPVLEGETATSVFNQPAIRGTVAKDPTTGAITDLVVPSDLVIETDTMGGTPLAILLASNSLSDIVAAINTALSAGPWGTAEDREGCLQIYTNGTGEGAFIRIVHATNDYDFDGIPDDAAPALGLPRDPDPTATVRAGDLSPAPVRPSLQGNPQGTAFIAHGEDRVATSYNRALSRLSRNADHLYTMLAAPVATPIVIDIDPTDPVWTSRLIYNGSGQLDQIDLSTLADINPEWAGRLFVGRCDRNSTLSDIARFWTVTDVSGRELLAWVPSSTENRRPVRVGAVTRGQRLTTAPTFADDVSAPTGALANTAGPAPDGLNALGVNRTKISGAQITSIRNRTAIVCGNLLPGADFVWAGVTVGDIATIAGSTVNEPFNHNGDYIVEEVIDGREIILRPASPDDLNALNPGSGDYGTVTIRSSGTWESSVFITLDPPLPRFPDDGLLRIVVGHEAALGRFLDDVALHSLVKASEEVDDFVVRQLWHKQTLGGAYDGMNPGTGGGFFASVAQRPATFANVSRQAHSSGTLVRGPFTGSIIAGNILVAESASSPPHPDSFTLDDVGRTVRISGTPTYLDEEIFVIEEVVDGAHARLVAPSYRVNVELPAKAGVTYSIYSNARHHFGAGVAVVGPDNVNNPATGPQRTFGTAFFREVVDDATTTAALAGAGFLHVERVKLTYEGADTNRMDVDVTGYPGGNSLTIDFDPEDTSNIYAEDGGSTKSAPGYVQGTLVRILNGSRAGWYRLKATVSASTRITLLNLDGSVPTAFANPGFAVKVAFYNVTFATNSVLKGRPSSGSGFATAGVSAYYDAYEHGDDYGTGLYVGWRGTGAGIYSALNDPEFKAYDNGDGASGYHTYVVGYIPAHGPWYQFTAKDTGADAARGARGFTSVASSYFLDFTQWGEDPLSGTVDPEGWSGWFHQKGEDPAIIATKSTGAPSGPNPTYLWYVPKAAIVAQANDSSDGPFEIQGGAEDTLGPVYNRKGGIFSDSGVSSAFWLHAVNAHQHFPPDQAYYDADKGTELGAAGRVVPSTLSDSWAAGTLDPADYTVFPDTPAHGMLTTTDSDAIAVLKSNDTPLGLYKYLGFSLEVQSGDTYTIVGLWFSSGGTPTAKIALHGGSTVAVGGSSGVNFRILGKRWYRSHIDVADWLQVGTEDTSAGGTDLPLITADPDLLNTRVSVVPDNVQLPDLGLQSYCPWAPVTDGVALGVADAATSAMTHVYVTSSAYTGAQSWSSSFESPLFTHGWKSDSKEPRSPFPNSGVFANADGTDSANEILNGSYTGDLSVDDYAASFPSGTCQLAWSPSWGGSLEISGNSGAQCKIWQRGRTYVMTSHLAVHVQLRAAATGLSVSGTRQFTITLSKADGTVLATANASITADNLPHDASVTLELDGITASTADAMRTSKVTDSVHVTAQVTLGSSGETINILEFKTEPYTRPQVVSGPQIVAGQQLAHGFRFTDPVRGFQTVGPAEVKLLGGLDYARNESWPTYTGTTSWADSATTGTQELRGGPGLVRMRSDDSYDDWVIAKTLAANAITGDVDAWMTDLKTVATTGYLGSSPGSCTGDATAVSDACDAAIAETDPTDKLELADIAVGLAYDLIDCVTAAISRLSSGTNSGSASTRANLSSYKSDIEDAIAGGGSITNADEYNSLAANAPEENWVRPYVDYYRLFSQGVHSASITLYNGAFDPLWYARQGDFIYNVTGSSAGGDLEPDSFILPGTTGFLIPLNPPHGAVLTSLAVGLSFRAHSSGRWGIFRTMVDELKQLGRDGATSMTYPDVAVVADWDALAGVKVELWRYNCIDFDVDEGDFASWTEHEPEFGFGEMLATFNIDLSGVSPPSDTANTVDNVWPATGLGFGASKDAYIGKEHFEKRNWSLLDYWGSGSDRARVDRRHYAYMMVVRFFGGMRYENAGLYEPFVRGDEEPSSSSGGDSRWELPQAITRTIGDPDGTLAEGQIYGFFDSATMVQDRSMNEPWDDNSFPPQVKFRGARLGWITDRAGDGGW